MENDPQKIVFKSTRLPGVDKALVDFEVVSTTPICMTRVLTNMFREKSRVYIGLTERIMAGEVVQIGQFKIKYKIVKGITGYLSKPKGYLYQIRRADGNIITDTDINAVEVGKFAIIKSRRGTNQIREQINDMLNS